MVFYLQNGYVINENMLKRLIQRDYLKKMFIEYYLSWRAFEGLLPEELERMVHEYYFGVTLR